jgi:hypothetical protein
MAILKPEQLSSGSYSISGSFSGSFSGDGSNLANLPIPQIETGSFVTTSSFNAFTGSYNTGSFTGSFTGNGSGLTGIVSSSFAQTASYAPNFANTNLTFTGDRSHNTAGNDLQITTDNGNFGESFIYMTPTLAEIGTANAYVDYSTRIDSQLSPGGTVQRISPSGVSIGFGGIDAQARLDVKAQGALSTDIAFRVRNSADNNDFITIAGNGNITVGSSTALPSNSTLRVFSGFGGGTFLNMICDSTSFGIYHGLSISSTVRTGYFALETAGNQGSSITRFRGGGSTSANAKITAYIDHPGDTDKTGHWHFRTQVHLGDAYRAFNTNLGRHTLLIETGSAPTTSSANSFIFYSSASSAGNAAPHFRTENGSIIKLYQQSAVTSSQGLADALTNLGLLTGSSTITTPSAFPFTGSALITGSLGVTGSTSILAYTASADNIFKIRNSANTADILTCQGNETTIIGRNQSTEPRLLINRAGSTKMLLGGTTDLNITFQSSGYGQINTGAQGLDIIASTGDIRTRNSSTFTLLKGNFFGIGQATPAARLDVTAQGALSTDIAFRVRNSADNANLVESRGDGMFYINNPNFAAALYARSSLDVFTAGTGLTYTRLSPSGNVVLTLKNGSSNTSDVQIGAGSTDTVFWENLFTYKTTNKNFTFFAGTAIVGGNSGNSVIWVRNGTSAPSVSSADMFGMYSADITAGNAAPHFRTENDSIIKLYKEIQPALSGSANTGDPATDALIEAMKTIILNLGFGASS